MVKKSKLGLLLGLVAGATFGFLFAPRKGKELRGKLKKELGKGGAGSKAVFDELKKVGEDLAETYKDSKLDDEIEKAAKKVTKRVKSSATKIKKEVKKVKSAAQKVKKAVKDEVKELKTDLTNEAKTAKKKIEIKAKKIKKAVKKQTKKK